jgi:hypothetical protein
LSYYVPGQKPDGGTTGRTKNAHPKFDDYTQNSSDLEFKFKNRPQNSSVKDVKPLCEILVKLKIFHLYFFMDLPGA